MLCRGSRSSSGAHTTLSVCLKSLDPMPNNHLAVGLPDPVILQAGPGPEYPNQRQLRNPAWWPWHDRSWAALSWVGVRVVSQSVSQSVHNCLDRDLLVSMILQDVRIPLDLSRHDRVTHQRRWDRWHDGTSCILVTRQFVSINSLKWSHTAAKPELLIKASLVLYTSSFHIRQKESILHFHAQRNSKRRLTYQTLVNTSRAADSALKRSLCCGQTSALHPQGISERGLSPRETLCFETVRVGPPCLAPRIELPAVSLDIFASSRPISPVASCEVMLAWSRIRVKVKGLDMGFVLPLRLGNIELLTYGFPAWTLCRGFKHAARSCHHVACPLVGVTSVTMFCSTTFRFGCCPFKPLRRWRPFHLCAAPLTTSSMLPLEVWVVYGR